MKQTKKVFTDKSYLEIKKEENEIYITISARDPNDSFKRIVNSCKISSEDFESLMKGIE